jgi:hypothetical protein
MLVKVKSIDIIKNKVKGTQLDIDDYGSVIPLKELEFNVPADDDSIIQTLKNSSYAAIFTEDSIEDNNSIIILAIVSDVISAQGLNLDGTAGTSP